MAPVCIHLNQEIIAIADAPVETMDIGAAQAKLPGTRTQEKPARMASFLQIDHRARRIVGTGIIHDEDVQPVVQAQDCRDQRHDIVPLVIGGDNHQRL